MYTTYTTFFFLLSNFTFSLKCSWSGKESDVLCPRTQQYLQYIQNIQLLSLIVVKTWFQPLVPKPLRPNSIKFQISSKTQLVPRELWRTHPTTVQYKGGVLPVLQQNSKSKNKEHIKIIPSTCPLKRIQVDSKRKAIGHQVVHNVQ